MFIQFLCEAGEVLATLYHSVYIHWLNSLAAQPSLHQVAFCDVHLFFLPCVH